MKATKATVARMLDLLEQHYGAQQPTGPPGPYEMVLYTNCGYPPSDTTCAKGYEALKADVGTTPERILAAPKRTLARLMKSGGMVPDLRAQRLKDIARMVTDAFGGDLNGALTDMIARTGQDPVTAIRDAKKALMRFPVIGAPGAEKILLFAGMAPLAAVPSAFVHVPSRLWFGEPEESHTAAYRAVQAVMAKELPETFEARQRAYLLLKRHGQLVCKRSAPKCEICPVSGMCAFFRANRT